MNITKGMRVIVDHLCGKETGKVLSVTAAEREICASVLMAMDDGTICRFPITHIKEVMP